MKLRNPDRLTSRNVIGFTIIEILIVIGIIGVLAAIAYPNYIRFVKKGKRTDMMTELQNISSNIASQKLAKGSYTNIKLTDIGMTSNGTLQFPRNNTTLYNVTITPINSGKLSSGKWKIIATPTTNSIMRGDGNLSIDFQGVKCHQMQCGQDDTWRQ